MKIFITGFIQVFFVAINTFLISKELYLGVFMCSFTISLVWSFNVKKIAFGTMKERILYSTGAGFGAVAGLALSVFIFQQIK